MNTLVPRTLDVVITRITPKTVYYLIQKTKQEEHWRVPQTSSFDITNLVPGTRYLIQTQVITELQWNYKAQNRLPTQTYDWVSAEELSPRAKPQAKNQRETALSKELAEKPLADNGDLFSW